MNVQDLMSREPRVVRTVDRLDAVARVLWEQDCGIVPVVDGAGVLVGVVTDRDLCMASYTQGRALTEIGVHGVMARSVRTCRPEDSVATALQTMTQAQVHRLPVVDARGVPVGIVSTNDLVRAAHGRPAAVDAAAVLKALAGIGAPRRQAAPAPTVKAVVPAPGAIAAAKPAAAATAAPAVSVAAPAAAAAAPAAAAKPVAAERREKAVPAAAPAKAGKPKPKAKGRKA